MKRLLLTCIALATLTVTASTALGQEVQISGLQLAFDDCGGATTLTWACNANGNTTPALTVVASVKAPVLSHLVGESGALEVAYLVPVPDWWKVGVCAARTAASFSVSYGSPGSVCVDYFNTAPFTNSPAGANTYQIGPDPAVGDPYGPIDANRIRVRTVSAQDYFLATSAPQPAVGAPVFLFAATWFRRASTGTGSCVGCSAEACLLFKGATLDQQTGETRYIVNAVDPAAVNVIAWNNQGSDCNLVPTRTKTWGQIKSLYR